jgi:tRNA pseudouridine55 synthase
VDAVLLVDKPRGLTSHQTVAIVKKRLQVKKAGHAGTLDPLATGLLLVGIGEATKLTRFLAQEEKEYEATALLGIHTDTGDTEGEILSRQEPQVEEGRLETALANFRGKIKQRPPVYSALKHRGKPLYQWARKGVLVEVPEREVEIFSLKMEKIDLPLVSFRVSCSKGTYIRALCRDLGEILGCGAALSALRRTKSGPFTVENAATLERIGALDTLPPETKLSLVDTLPSLALVPLDEESAEGVRRGHQLAAKEVRKCLKSLFLKGDMLKITAPGGGLVALAQALYDASGLDDLAPETQALRTVRVFNKQL